VYDVLRVIKGKIITSAKRIACIVKILTGRNLLEKLIRKKDNIKVHEVSFELNKLVWSSLLR
jgi:hypothetical protein